MQRYLVLSGDDFESFRPTGATHCADGGDIWREVDSTPNVTPIGAEVGYGAPKRKILTNLYQISRYERVAPAHRLYDFCCVSKLRRVITQ